MVFYQKKKSFHYYIFTKTLGKVFDNEV